MSSSRPDSICPKCHCGHENVQAESDLPWCQLRAEQGPSGSALWSNGNRTAGHGWGRGRERKRRDAHGGGGGEEAEKENNGFRFREENLAL